MRTPRTRTPPTVAYATIRWIEASGFFRRPSTLCYAGLHVCMYWWTAVNAANKGCKQRSFVQEDAEQWRKAVAEAAAEEEEDMEAAEAAAAGSEPWEDELARPRRRRGRPRLDDPRRYGSEIVDVLKAFILARGQLTVDHHRLRNHAQILGAPLSAMVKACAVEGMKVSRAGVYNLTQPPRRNSTSSNARGVLDTRPAARHAGENKYHSRARFSATNMKVTVFLLVKGNLGYPSSHPPTHPPSVSTSAPRFPDSSTL